MKSKIIIHNKTDYPDADAILYVWKTMTRPEEYTYFEFESGIKVQRIKRDKGYTLYVYK